jgi:beta-1,4-mannosyl-glycoprotein beta-1,4-N-acetylglucosaminyltransferase
MKIFDCFMYFDEDLILDIRLNVLNQYVDKFVIIESGEDFRGNKKKQLFNINKFSKFKDKIIYLFFDTYGDLKGDWDRENFQRNYIKNGLTEADNNDLIIISDVDEIPNLKNFNFSDFPKEKYFSFEQNLYYFKLNMLVSGQGPWHGSKACKKKNLKSPQWLRNAKSSKRYPWWRLDKITFYKIRNGGWHFSYIKTPEAIQKKIKSFAHSEYDSEKFTSIENIEKSINEKKDLFHRNDHILEKVEIDNTYPDYIINNKSILKDFIA